MSKTESWRILIQFKKIFATSIVKFPSGINLKDCNLVSLGKHLSLP